MIITSQSFYNNKYQTITYQHYLLSPHDRHSGITKYRNEYWVGYKLNFITRDDLRAMKAGTYREPFFAFAQYKISMYCVPGKNADQGNFKGDFWLYCWYNLYTYTSMI